MQVQLAVNDAASHRCTEQNEVSVAISVNSKPLPAGMPFTSFAGD